MIDPLRVKQLQEFADDFNNRLNLAEKRYEDNRLNTLSKEQSNCLTEPSVRKSSKIKKPKFSCELFKEIPAWMPPEEYGDYFEDFKILKDKHEITPWEIYRVHLVKRSFEKQKNMLDGKNFVCREVTGKEFDDYSKHKPVNASLSSLGAKIINSFIKDNQRREMKIRQKEKDKYNFLHSKHETESNHWKFSNHIMEEFSRAPADKIVSYKKEPRKRNFIITDPYRIPKKEGDYFIKNIRRLDEFTHS